MSTKWIEEQYPLHWLVWNNEYSALEQAIKDRKGDLNQLDPRGRSPLHLAVALGHIESTRVMLRNEANANEENSKYWSVVQEAVSTGDPELVQLCLQHRDYQRYTRRTHGVPELLQKLREAPDFYVEMKWEFTSWVPLVSRVCPSDTYKVWKSGANVRIDTTLLGFDNMNWLRGSRSFVFKGQVDSATVMEIDHDACQVFSETMRTLPAPPDIGFLAPSDDQVAARLTNPIVTTYIDTDKISFERSKSGIWGWRSDKVESINNHECKVFSASNVELVTKTRVEHMTEQDKKTKKKNSHPFESILGIAEKEEINQAKVTASASNGELAASASSTSVASSVDMYNPSHITAAEYFDASLDLSGRDIGRPKEQTTKTQKFKANLWLAEDYPLSLPQQVVPIIDLMASSNAHFKKLRDFITLQLPAGFPVKIEIPLFHVLNARITFGNIFAADAEADGVHTLLQAGQVCCQVEERVFETPRTYSVIGGGDEAGPGPMHHRLRDEDDELLQFAIQQSLVEAGAEDQQVTVWEALNRPRGGPAGGGGGGRVAAYPDLLAEEDRQLQRALEESMRLAQGLDPLPTPSEPPLPGDSLPSRSPADGGPGESAEEAQLRLVMELSRKEVDEAERRRREEEEQLEQILKLSLLEK